MLEGGPSPKLRRWLWRAGYTLTAVWIVASALVYYVHITFAVYETHGETVDVILAPLYPE